MLEIGRTKVDVDIKMLMMVDSLDMTDNDRKIIAENCINCPGDRILITHGTDTMPETAQYIISYFKKKKITQKTVVLTGAMVPWTIKNTDSFYNLGCAVGGVQLLSPGVYIAMNGRFLEGEKAFKNKQIGIFEEKNS